MGFPHILKLVLVPACPVEHDTLRSRGEVSFNHFECLYIKDTIEFAIYGVKMGDAVLPEIHFDEDSGKAGGMPQYDHLSQEELVRLLQARDRRDATRFGLVWEANEIDRDKALNSDFVALDLDSGTANAG